MTFETKYNVNDIVEFRERDINDLLTSTAIGRIVAVGAFYDEIGSLYISYTVKLENSIHSEVVFEQQIVRKYIPDNNLNKD